MFRLWGKLWKSNRLIKDYVVEDSSNKTRTKKVLDSLEELCYEFDLSCPIWLDKNIKEFQRNDKTRFFQDNFIDHIDFDNMEIQVIEED